MDCRRGNTLPSFGDLPEELLLPIFSTLPVSSILACRRVCKSWYLFISTPYFANYYRENPPFTSLILSNGEHFSFLELNSDYDYSIKPNNPKIMPNPFGSCNAVTRLVGSCNGFLCFTHKNKVLVSNPLTRMSYMLPDPGFISVIKRFYGFGFCPKTKLYKVIEIVRCIPKKDDNVSLTEMHVFTLGIDKHWRRVLHPNVPFPKIYDITNPSIQFCEVNGKGILHWIAEKMDTDDYLYSFDITDEKFRPIPPPVGLKRDVSTRSVFLHGCFCLLHKSTEKNLEIWCMGDYMVPDSWTLRLIPQTCLKGGQTRHGWFNPVGVWKKGEILLTKKHKDHVSIVSCNVEQTVFTKLKFDNTIPKYYAASCFVPNFRSALRTRSALGTRTIIPQIQWLKMTLSSDQEIKSTLVKQLQFYRQ